MTSEDPTYYLCMNCGFHHYTTEECMVTKEQAEKIEEMLEEKDGK